MKILLQKTRKIVIYIFAIIGFIFICAFIISKTGLTDKIGITDTKYDYFNKSRILQDQKNFVWINTEEYLSLKESFKKEKNTLKRVEGETDIKSRLVLSILFVEQMRLFNSDRELFKKAFEPLKILGVQSQFSWGVLGLKQETLIKIENNLKDINSPFYLGKDYEKVLDYSANATISTDEQRFNRVTDEHNQYYSYLYTSIYIKQIENQWKNAGFDISDRPEILDTLYNIGFVNSKPNANPQVGGSEIDIDTEKYSFGRLAYEFYYSDELLEEFPR
ncbi:MAG: hypothetical protein WCG60_02275 [bacterium]